MLTENPEAYQGKLVMLGGTIIAVKQEKESTQYLVLEYKLDKWNRPDRSVPSSGIFIATTSKAIDPVAYKPGTLITTFGKVIGSRTQQFNEVLHVCPVVAIREIHEIVAPRWDYYGLGGL
jgi:outer membrane lipoprotein